MKTLNKFSILFAFTLIFLGNSIYGQVEHIITLYVDTENINPQNINEVCYFTVESSDGESSQSDIDIENFTVYVGLGDSVIWKGISTSSEEDDVVDIKKIIHGHGTNFFDKHELNGNGKNHEEVTGKIKKGKPNNKDKYKIKFTVKNNGTPRNSSFMIDPILRIRQ